MYLYICCSLLIRYSIIVTVLISTIQESFSNNMNKVDIKITTPEI